MSFQYFISVVIVLFHSFSGGVTWAEVRKAQVLVSFNLLLLFHRSYGTKVSKAKITKLFCSSLLTLSVFPLFIN